MTFNGNFRGLFVKLMAMDSYGLPGEKNSHPKFN